MDRSIDLRRVALAAAFGLARAAFVHDRLEPPADPRGEALRADRLRALHEALVPARLDLGRDMFESEIVGARALDRLVLERAHAVEVRRVEPVEKEAKIVL